MLNIRFLALAGIVLTAAMARLLPHPPNCTPIAAMALFGGASFAGRRAALFVPLLAMYLSDLVLGFFVYDFGWYHGSMPYVYGSFALIAGLGLWLRRRRTPLRIAATALAGSVLFFLITNFGVWAGGSLYPKTAEGLIACYVAAVPFFRNTLAGDAFFTAVLFGGFALAERCCEALRDAPARHLTQP